MLSEHNGKPKTFSLLRGSDATGVSGTGVVAHGVQFVSGEIAMRWLTETTSTAIYSSAADVEAIHGHGGLTIIAWHDKSWARGYDCAVMDAMENAQWGSITTSLDDDKFVRPEYINAEQWPSYLAGYLDAVREMRGRGCW